MTNPEKNAYLLTFILCMWIVYWAFSLFKEPRIDPIKPLIEPDYVIPYEVTNSKG